MDSDTPGESNSCGKDILQNAYPSDSKTLKRKYNGEKRYTCSYCEMKYSTYQSFKMHEKWHTEENPFHCNLCEKSFGSYKVLRNHKSSIHKGEPYRCKHCNKTFTDRKTHQNHRCFKCTECAKDFKNDYDLQIHISKHTEEKTYECNFCDESFRTKQKHTLHLKRHNGENNGLKKKNKYSCDQCSSTFTRKDNLKTHTKKHTGLKESNKSSLNNETNQEITKSNSVLQKSVQIGHLGSVKQSVMKKTNSTSKQKSLSKTQNILAKKSSSNQSPIPLFCDDPAQVILWLQHNKLLKSLLTCDSCCDLMNWSENSTVKDGFEWICQTKGCMKYSQSVCLKSGSFFYNSHIRLPDWVDIMYLWCENVKPTVSSNIVSVSPNLIMDCYSNLRQVCWGYFIENPIKLGGPGIIIEIDVARFWGSTKAKKMKDKHPPMMVLGIIDLSNKHLMGYMEIVQSNNPTTLLPRLINVVKPGSIIYTKEAKEYRTLQGIKEMDTTVKHSINFLDIDTPKHNSNMETFWEKHHNNINEIYEYNEMDQNSYLQEFMWRDCFYDDKFGSLCQQISDQYPL